MLNPPRSSVQLRFSNEFTVLPVESALIIVVPEAERLVKPFRDRHDPSAKDGVPAHITLLYPFKPPAEINNSVLDKLNFRAFCTFRVFSCCNPSVWCSDTVLGPGTRQTIPAAYYGDLGLLSKNAPLWRKVFRYSAMAEGIPI
jgi:hypothetical protein